ncbi:hypothetical protein HXX76_002078 [Chlamydomonas incerta]|uniref:Uncharacterized protein n=1 Tax=Chlamydomonas incerta TaxID=51695 RepID=A0A835WAE1_CHLIN|nr:hypothetical protein HXX76_002078 [Chlamydomonas incerta]|eukprot:KAG2443732.1 hypothetical protein HXX76_002078 [Chlamydomonas incerta]
MGDADRGGGAVSAVLRQLDDAARAGDPAAVLQMVERQGHEFDEAALVAALRAPEAGRAERLAGNSTYQSLLSMVVAGAERLSAAQAVEVAASLGRLHMEDQMVLDSLGRNLVSRLHELSGSQLADLVEAYAASDASPGKVLADAVHQRLAGGNSGDAGGGGGGGSQQQEVDTGRVAIGRATADGVQLGTAEAGREQSGIEGRGGLQGEDAARVRRGLERLGYGAPDAAGTLPRQGQSDRSQGLDYS